MCNSIKAIFAAVAMSFLLLGQGFAASGTFNGVEGERVGGSVEVTETAVKLSANFNTTSGPDLYVYLGNDNPTKIIAVLKKNKGSQTYALPEGIDLSKYSSVFIHCKKYNHTCGKASIR
jgi:hypothetical protein